MIAIWVGHDEFARVGHNFVDRDAVMLLEVGWRNQERLVAKELVAGLGVGWPDILHGGFEPAGIRLRDTIPLLGSTEVKEVDAVKIDVLQMPCKCRLPHAEV